MFVSILANKPDPIMMLTFMPINNYITDNQFIYYLNSVGEQLLYVPGEKLMLDFPFVINSIIVDIVTLNDHAEISWKNDPEKVFILKGGTR